jgi:ATP phosphoribosyltransferase
MSAAENTGTHGPNAGEYIQHHLQHLQMDFSFQGAKQTGLVDFSLFNLDSLFYSVILGSLACFLLWRAASRATAGVPGRFQAAVEIMAEMVDKQARGVIHNATSRKLVFETNRPGVRLLVLRGSDVPTYVQFGAADLGVAGKDMLLEHGGGEFYYEPVDLGIARCRLMTAAVIGVTPRAGRLRVATKYVNVARRYYAAQGRQVDIIKLYGGMELAPLMGLADEIVDIVDTGNTLTANRLEARELIADISSRLIVNKGALKTKFALIQPLLDNLRAMVEGRR